MTGREKRLLAQKRCREAVRNDPVRHAALKKYRRGKFAEYYANPEFKERITAQNRSRYAKYMKSPEYRERKNAKARARYAERMKNPEYRKKLSTQSAARSKKYVRKKPTPRLIFVKPEISIVESITESLIIENQFIEKFDYEELIR